MRTSAELVQLAAGRVLPDATSGVHIDPARRELGFGTNKADASRNRRVLNLLQTRGHLEGEFFGSPDGNANGTRSFVNRTLDRGRIGMVGSRVGYFERSGVIVATELSVLDPDELEARRSEAVQTTLPSQLDAGLRLAYTAAMLAGLAVSHEHADEHQIPVVLQHLTPDVSRQGSKFPRSIPMPHATFGNFDLRTFTPGAEKSPHLQAEQAVADPGYQSLLALSLYAYINSAIKGTEFEERNFGIRPREVEPLGHEMLLDIPADQLTKPDQIRYVSKMLDLQDQGYRDFYREHGGRRPVHIVGSDGIVLPRKRQPATRDYLLVGVDDTLRVLKSPLEYSHAGCVEAAGAVLLRSPDFEPLASPAEVNDFRRAAASRMQEAIDVVSF